MANTTPMIMPMSILLLFFSPESVVAASLPSDASDSVFDQGVLKASFDGAVSSDASASLGIYYG